MCTINVKIFMLGAIIFIFILNVKIIASDKKFRGFLMKFETNIPIIESKIGYTFKDKSLLRQAFTRSSFCNEAKADYQSNEVLEFFGDSVLSASIVTLFLRDFAFRYKYGIRTNLSEGDFSNIKSKLSDKDMLSKAVSNLELQNYLMLGEGDAKLGIQNEPSVKEDLFESIIGAIYVDSGMDMKTVIESVSVMLKIEEYLKCEPKSTSQSAKNSLQEYCADKKRKLPAPIYKTISETGPDHKKTYERGCYIGEALMGVGVGKNLKIADSAAAEKALAELMSKEDTRTLDNAGKDAKKLLESTISKLKQIRGKGNSSPFEFKDLGQKTMGKDTVFLVECKYADKSEIGEGVTKKEAKLDSAEKMLKKLKTLQSSKKQKK